MRSTVSYLSSNLQQKDAIERGLTTKEEFIPGPLKLKRKASTLKGKGGRTDLFMFAIAVSEENASAGEVVTAPTCGYKFLGFLAHLSALVVFFLEFFGIFKYEIIFQMNRFSMRLL